MNWTSKAINSQKFDRPYFDVLAPKSNLCGKKGKSKNKVIKYYTYRTSVIHSLYLSYFILNLPANENNRSTGAEDVQIALNFLNNSATSGCRSS